MVCGLSVVVVAAGIAALVENGVCLSARPGEGLSSCSGPASGVNYLLLRTVSSIGRAIDS